MNQIIFTMWTTNTEMDINLLTKYSNSFIECATYHSILLLNNGNSIRKNSQSSYEPYFGKFFQILL